MSVIKLLDNSLNDKATLLERMLDDNFYYGYLGKAALSSSSLKLLLDSPRTYYNVTKYSKDTSTPALFLGRLIHHLALEPEVVPNLYMLSSVKSRNTNKYKEEVAANPKMSVVLENEWRMAEKCVDALQRNEAYLQLIQGAEFEQPEVGMIDGLPFRAKADILAPNAVIDLKTTSDLSGFQYSAKKYGYDVQCYIYCTLFGKSWETFKFVAIDKKSCDIGIYDVTEEFYERGKSKTLFAIETYKEFFPNGIEAEDVTDKLDQYYIKDTLK